MQQRCPAERNALARHFFDVEEQERSNTTIERHINVQQPRISIGQMRTPNKMHKMLEADNEHHQTNQPIPQTRLSLRKKQQRNHQKNQRKEKRHMGNKHISVWRVLCIKYILFSIYKKQRHSN